MPASANSLGVLIKDIGPLVQEVLREKGFLYNITNTDFSAEAAQPGSQIKATFPVSLTVADVVAGPTASAVTALTPTEIPINLEHHRFSQFGVTVKQEMEISNPGSFIAGQIQEGVRAVVNDFESTVWTAVFASASTANAALSSASYGVGGGLSSSLATITTHKYRLFSALAPSEGRTLVVDSQFGGDLSNNTTFLQANTAGTTELLREGRLGRILGFDVLESNNIPQNQFGSGSAGLAMQRQGMGVAVRAANTVGDTIVIQDEVSGFPITITAVEGEFQRKWMVSGLWGIAAIRPQFLTTLHYT